MEARDSGDRIEVRLRSLEQRLDSLEQVGKEGLPAIRLTAIEVRLGHVEERLRDLKEQVARRFDEQGKRFDSLEQALISSRSEFHNAIISTRPEFRDDLKGVRNILLTALASATGIIGIVQYLTTH